MFKGFYIFFFGLCMLSCNDAMVFSEYKSIQNGFWSKDNIIQFTLPQMDTLNSYNCFINIRNDQTFPYRNLFLITELNYPNGETVKDTLEYDMALPNGEWLGKGQGNLKENKLWFRENIVFPISGVYTLEISHAMRHLGSVEGIEQLEGITDVGFQIEKSN